MKSPDEIKKGLEWDEVDESLRKIRFDDAGEVVEWKPKTSTDTKNGLLCCTIEGGCNDCPYQQDCFQTDGFSELAGDALALIQQLESKLECSQMTIDGLTATLLKCDTIIKQLEAERDAAVEDLEDYATLKCFACKYYEMELTEAPCDECKIMGKGNRDMFEWRGVQKEPEA